MINKNDPFYHEFYSHVINITDKDIVLDVGTPKRFAKEMASLQSLFKENYFAIGYKPKNEYGVDNCDLNADILHLPIVTSTVDAVICLEVLEHVTNPQKAINELRRVVKPKGTVILTTPFLYPYHGKGDDFTTGSHDNYPDFWRFTHQGLQFLFKKFSKVKIIPFSSTAQFYFNMIVKSNAIPILKSKYIQNVIAAIQQKYPGNATHRHLVVAQK